MCLKSVLFMFFLLKLSVNALKQKRTAPYLPHSQDLYPKKTENSYYGNVQSSEEDILASPSSYKTDQFVEQQPPSFNETDSYSSEQLPHSVQNENQLGSFDPYPNKTQFRPIRPQIKEEVKEFLKEFLERRKLKILPKTPTTIKPPGEENPRKCLQRNAQGALIFDICTDTELQEPAFLTTEVSVKKAKSLKNTKSQKSAYDTNSSEFIDSEEQHTEFQDPSRDLEESADLASSTEEDSLLEAGSSEEPPEESIQSDESSVIVKKKVNKKKKKKKKLKKNKSSLISLVKTLDLVKLLGLQSIVKSVEKPVPKRKAVIEESNEEENCLKLWSEWQPTAACSQSCGGCAQQSFRRKCLSSPKCPCNGIIFKAEICNSQPCRPPQTPCCDNLSPKLASTGEYVCEKSENDAIVKSQLVQEQPQVLELELTGSSNIKQLVEEPQLQLEEPCCADPRGTWSSWRAADQCNKECGGFGRQSRKRLCLSTAHGCPCIGNTDEVVACNLQPCPFSARTPSSCAPGLTIQFRNSNPLCVSPRAQLEQQSFNIKRYQPNQQQKGQYQPNSRRFQTLNFGNTRESFVGPGVQFDGRPVQVREQEDKVEQDKEKIETYGGIESHESVSQEKTRANNEENTSFTNTNLFKPLEKLSKRIENGELKPDSEDELQPTEYETFPVNLQYSNIVGDLPKVKENGQINDEKEAKNSSESDSVESPSQLLFNQQLTTLNSTELSLPFDVAFNKSLYSPPEDKLKRSKRQTRSKRQQQSIFPPQTSSTFENQLDYQRFLQQQASGTNSVINKQPATLGSTISYSDLFGYSLPSSNPQANSRGLIEGNTYPFSSPIQSQVLGPGPLQSQSAIPGIQTPSAAVEDRTGQAALVGIHPGQLEWREDQVRAAELATSNIPNVAASAHVLQRAGVDSGVIGPVAAATRSSSATQSTSYFLGIKNQGKSFNQRNGRILSIVPGYLVVQSKNADVAAKFLSQLRSNRLGSNSNRLSVIYPALRSQGTTKEQNQNLAAAAATASAAAVQALANQATLLNARAGNSQPAALELTQPGRTATSQILVDTGQVVNQEYGFGGINPISVGGHQPFDGSNELDPQSVIQQGQEEAPLYFESQTQNLDEEDPPIEYAPSAKGFRKIKEDELEEEGGKQDEENTVLDRTSNTILDENGIYFAPELTGNDENNRRIGSDPPIFGMDADPVMIRKIFGVEQSSETEIKRLASRFEAKESNVSSENYARDFNYRSGSTTDYSTNNILQRENKETFVGTENIPKEPQTFETRSLKKNHIGIGQKVENAFNFKQPESKSLQKLNKEAFSRSSESLQNEDTDNASNSAKNNNLRRETKEQEKNKVYNSFSQRPNVRRKRQQPVETQQQVLLTSLQRQLLQNGANGPGAYQKQTRQPKAVANLLAMRRLQQQFLQQLLRDRLARLQQSQAPSTQTNEGKTFGSTALQQGEAAAASGLTPSQSQLAENNLTPVSNSAFVNNLTAALSIATSNPFQSQNLSPITSNFSSASIPIQPFSTSQAISNSSNSSNLSLDQSLAAAYASALAQSKGEDQAVSSPQEGPQKIIPTQQDEVPPLIPFAQPQKIATYAGTSRTQPGVMEDRQSSIFGVNSATFGQSNGSITRLINKASGSQLVGSNTANILTKPAGSGSNNTLQTIRQQQQTAILATIFARAANLGKSGSVATVQAPLPAGPLKPQFQPQGLPTVEQSSIVSPQSSLFGGYAIPPGLAGVPISAQSSVSTQNQGLTQQLKTFLATQKTVAAPSSIPIQQASSSNQQSLNSQTALLQQQLSALLSQQQQLTHQSQQQLQKVLQLVSGNKASIAHPQPAVLNIQHQVQSQNNPLSALQIQSILSQIDTKGAFPPGYAIVQQPIYVIQHPAANQPTNTQPQGVVRVSANNIRQQFLQSQRLKNLQKIQQQQQQGRNSLQSIYLNDEDSLAQRVGFDNYYMGGIAFDLSTGNRGQPVRVNLADDKQANGIAFQKRIRQGSVKQQPQLQRPIQIQPSKQSQQSESSLSSNSYTSSTFSQTQNIRQPNCCVLGGIWDLWTEWSRCGTGCGGCGIRKRTRLCASASQGCPCYNEQVLSSQTEICNRNPCSLPDQACCGPLKPKLAGNSYVCA